MGKKLLITAVVLLFAINMQAMQILEEVEVVAIKWPEKHKDHVLSVADISHQGLSTLCVMRDNCRITLFDTAPSHIDCSALTEINISHNKLKELPLGLITKTCSQVLNLNASHNSISHVSFKEAVESDLEVVNLSNNKLESFNVGKLFKFYPIESINISHNQLKTFKWSLDDCNNLKSYPHIDVRGNLLSDERKEELCESYSDARQSQLRGRILETASVGFVSSYIVGVIALPLLFAPSITTVSALGTWCAIGLPGGLGVGVLTGGIIYGLQHQLCCRDELQKIEEQ